MGKKTEYKHKKKNATANARFLKLFFVTLTLTFAAGLAGLAAHRWVTAPARQKVTELVNNEPAPAPQKKSLPQAEQTLPEAPDSEEEAEPQEPPSRYQAELSDLAFLEENNIYVREAADPGQVTLAFAGDILFDDNYSIMSRVKASADISQGVAPELIARMQAADVMMLNNEFPYSHRGTPTEGKQYTFRARPETAAFLQDMGVDLVSLANNHAYDHGPEALLDTFDALREAGIPYVGAGRNIGEARKPVYYIVGDLKVAFVSATQIERLDAPDTPEATEDAPGVFRCWNGAKLLEVIREAKENSDFVVAYIHWGTENTQELDWAQLKQAPELVEAGADLVIGDHPHCLQAISAIQGVPVVYSLGNFWFSSKTLDTGLVEAVVDGTGLVSLRFVPCVQEGCRTRLLVGEEKERVLSYLRGISGGVRIDEEGYITW